MSNESVEIKIGLNEQNKLFAEHLDISNNHRIFFSGLMGMGKTYFLRDFFKQEANNYDVYHLYPVNYQISSNEKILDYIKYDILIRLLKRYPGQFTDDKIKLLLIQLGKKGFNRLINILECIPEVSGFFTSGKKIKKAYDEVKENLENSKIDNFLEILETEPGSIYEKDFITSTIREILNKVENKDSVLILDDLDRIDPEHIFRILNVFTAHHDLYTEENKFGFKKVILVGDVNNIKNIFRAKYGLSTDFNGYIDKFYSQEIYYFENVDELLKTTDDLMFKDMRYFGNTEYRIQVLSYFLTMLILNKQFTSRHLIKLSGIKIFDQHHKENEIFNAFSILHKIYPGIKISELLEINLNYTDDKELFGEYMTIPRLKILLNTIGSIERKNTSFASKMSYGIVESMPMFEKSEELKFDTFRDLIEKLIEYASQYESQI